TLNDTNDTNNANNTNNASTNINIEEGQGYDSDESSHAPFNNNDLEESFDEDPHNYWIPTGIMAELTTNIYKGNSLLQQECQALLQSYPRNKNIKFNPLPMDKQIISHMSKQARNTDKVLSKLAYKFSSSVRPLDLAIKHVYEIKPTDEDQDGLASWKYLEEALLSTRLLTLDALSALNVARRNEVLKSFMPSHQPAPETESMFEGELQEIMEKGNREAKFFNDVLYQRRQQENLEPTDRKTGTGVVHRRTARINNKHTKLKKYGRRKVKRSTPYIAVLPSTTLGYDNNQKGILSCLETYTAITDPHSLSIATKYRNSAGSYTLDRSESHKGFPFTQTLFYLKHFFSTQKNGSTQASNRLMKIKHLHSIPAFQNRRIRSGKISAMRKRLYGINRYQRGFSPCIFTFRSPKVFRIRMQRETILLYMSTFWAFNQSTDIHKDSSTSHGDGKTDEHKISSILGQYSYNGKIPQASKSRQGETCRPTIQNGFQYKYRKIMARASLVNRVLRVYHKFERNDAPNTQSQNKGVNSRMLSNVQKDKHSYMKTSIINRKAYSRFSSSSVIREQTTTTAMDRATYTSQGKKSFGRTAKYDYTNRCFAVGLGSRNEQSDNFGKMVGKGKRRSYKPARNQDNFEGIDTMETTMQLDNYHKIGLYDHVATEYCDPGSTPSREDERTSRCSTTNDKSTIRMDFVETNVQHTTADLGVPEHRSICDQQEHSNEEIFQLEIRPSGISNRCIYPTLKEVESICKSTMDFITQSISQDSLRESHSDTDFPVMVFSSLVPDTNGSSSRYSNNVTSQSNLLRENHTSQKSQVENLHSTYIRKQLKDKGFSDRAAELCISPYDPKASESVSACMRKWVNWCASGGHDPIRSAISEVHTPVEEKAIGAHSIIVKVMKGIYNLRPPKQKPTDVVDV
ncbi:7160_t:CDS:2, partial [Gigaspora margarita]